MTVCTVACRTAETAPAPQAVTTSSTAPETTAAPVKAKPTVAEVAKVDQFPSVLWLFGCAGAKIADDAFLTAAHCVASETGEPASAYAPGSLVAYSLDRPPRGEPGDSELMRIVAVRIHPKWAACLKAGKVTEGQCYGAPDVAVVQAHALNAFRDAPAAELETARVADDTPIVAMAFDNEESEHLGALKKHHGKVASKAQALDAIGQIPGGVPFDETLYFSVVGPLADVAFANLGTGDSGAPTFDESGRIVGVNAYGICPDDQPTCERSVNSFHARIHKGAPHAVGEWLEQVLEENTKRRAKSPLPSAELAPYPGDPVDVAGKVTGGDLHDLRVVFYPTEEPLFDFDSSVAKGKVDDKTGAFRLDSPVAEGDYTVIVLRKGVRIRTLFAPVIEKRAVTLDMSQEPELKTDSPSRDATPASADEDEELDGDQ
jgi:hypothetical protein